MHHTQFTFQTKYKTIYVMFLKITNIYSMWFHKENISARNVGYSYTHAPFCKSVISYFQETS
jgi:hypothetical protein